VSFFNGVFSIADSDQEAKCERKRGMGTERTMNLVWPQGESVCNSAVPRNEQKYDKNFGLEI